MTASGVPIAGSRFAITGGASLLGQHLTRRLLDDGAAEVTIVDNFAFGRPDTLGHLGHHPSVRIEQADIRDTPALRAAIHGVDGVFHTAAFLTLPISRDPLLGIDVNVRGTRTVLQACVDEGVRKVVMSSSVTVYGNAVDETIAEDTPFVRAGLQPPAVLYGTSKIMAETMCEEYYRRHGLPYVALRYSSLYGEWQHERGLNALHLWSAYQQVARGQRPRISGDPNEVHDYLYAGDAAAANCLAMSTGVAGEAFTIATGKATSLDDAVALICRLCDRPFDPDYDRAADAVRFTASTELRYGVAKAAHQLGWEPKVDLEEGLRRLVDWAANTRSTL
jgi:UDP-glucose 4-epimerase